MSAPVTMIREREPGEDDVLPEVLGREPPHTAEEAEPAVVLPVPEWASAWMQREYPPPEWIVPGVVPKNTVGAIVAPSHTGKTAFAVSVTRDALEADHTVAYVMEESTAHDFRERLRAAGVTEEMQSRLLIFFQLGVRLDDEVWRKHLAGELKRNRVSACFFDTWSDVVELNQLDQQEVLPVMKELPGDAD